MPGLFLRFRSYGSDRFPGPSIPGRNSTKLGLKVIAVPEVVSFVFLDLYWGEGWIQTRSAWNWSKQSIWMGNGAGSFVLNWIDSRSANPVPPGGIRELGLTSFLFLLHDGGIFLTFVFLVWVGLEIALRDHWKILILLLPITIFFMPWTGSSGTAAFFVSGSSLPLLLKRENYTGQS